MSLFDPITKLPGVGEKRASLLHHLGIFNIEDLLTHYPFRYDDLQTKLPSQSLDGEKTAFKGIVSSPVTISRFGYKKTRIFFRLLVEHDNISVSFFNQPWLKDRIVEGQELAVFGIYDANRASLAGQKIIDLKEGSLNAVYPVDQHIRQKTLIQLIENAYAKYSDQIVDLVPASIRQTFSLLHRQQQIYAMHFPKSIAEAKAARRSAAFEEFFLFQMRLQLIKRYSAVNYGKQIDFDPRAVADFIKSLPYDLTDDQSKVVDQILKNMRKKQHMNRLLQGDVGSGKTVVAAISMLAAVSAGMQAAIMVPTEILARQHAVNLSKLFDASPLNVRVELLTSALKTLERRQVLSDLADGQIDIIVGTHALIQKDVKFHNLGLAVIDEQHRFGVKQRAALREQGQNPDILSMTATPIPRTLEITAYGQMDVSTISHLPAGRKAIVTRWVQSNLSDRVFQWLKSTLDKGAQAYVVTPLIEESEQLDLKNADLVYDQLKQDLFPYKVGLLHGRLSNEEKEGAIDAFSNGKFQVLVTTTVVEVGMDVKNATIMIVLDADRFGLAQLHQLRGRVGRGDKKSYAIFIADPKTQYGIDRMKALTDTNNGFLLAQKDLELRGPGDLTGIKQAGMPDFTVGDPVHDLKMMESAQEAASDLVSRENWDSDKENAGLVEYLSLTMDRYKDFD